MPITRLTIPGTILGNIGEWCDVDVMGQSAVYGELIRPGTLMLFHVQGEDLLAEAALDLMRWGLYLRIAVDGSGRSAAVAQDGRDKNPDTGQYYPAIVVIYDGTRIFEVPGAPPAYGQNCVEVVGKPSGGWWLWVQTSKFTFWRADLSPAGALDGHEYQIPLPEGTSQGFTQGSVDGTIRFLDPWRFTTPGMVCPNDAAGLVVGQNTSGKDRIVGTLGAGLFTVHRGPSFEPHIVSRDGMHWLACARTPEGPSLLLLEAPFALEAAEPPPAPDPIPVPIPVPPQENQPMDMPTQVEAEIERFVRLRPPPLTMPNSGEKDEAFRTYTGELASHLAWKFGPHWGTKRASSGRPNAKDSVAFQDERILYGFDIFSGVGTNSTRLQIATRGVNLTDPLPENENTGDQVFVAPPAFDTPAPKDWLSFVTPAPDPQPPTDPLPPTPSDVLPLLQQMLAEQREFQTYVRSRLR